MAIAELFAFHANAKTKANTFYMKKCLCYLWWRILVWLKTIDNKHD